jgi:hypothetical protein
MSQYDPEIEEIDLDTIELHEGPPDFDKPQVNEVGNQDDPLMEGEALGDDLAVGKHKGEPNDE